MIRAARLSLGPTRSGELKKPADCGLEGCLCGMVRPPVFSQEWVTKDPWRAAALLNHCYYLEAVAEPPPPQTVIDFLHIPSAANPERRPFRVSPKKTFFRG